MFSAGKAAALNAYGVEEDPQTPTWKERLPNVLGATAALGGLYGGYRYFRAPHGTVRPQFKELRDLAAKKGFNELVDVSHIKPEPSDPDDPLHMKLWYKAMDHLRPQVNEDNKLNAINKFKLWALHGPGAIPVGSSHRDGSTFRIDQHGNPVQTPLYVQGVVAGRHTGAYHGGRMGAHIEGGRDLEGDFTTKQKVDDLARGGKGVEAKLLQQYAPEAMPQTYTDLTQFFPPNAEQLKQTPEGRLALVEMVRQNAKKTFGHGRFLMKPVQGLQSGGEFPYGTSKWRSSLARYEKHFAKPGVRENFDKLSDVDQAAYLSDRGLYEGHTIHSMLKNPREGSILQQLIPQYNGEYRVHSLGGQAGIAHPRWDFSTKTPEKELTDFVQKIVDKLPPEYQQGHYGFDVATGIDPKTKKQTMHVIEMNPYEVYSGPDHTGGGSGFLDPHVLPLAAQRQYKHVTGKHHPLPAAIRATGLGVGAGAATTLGAHKLLSKMDEQPDPNDPNAQQMS